MAVADELARVVASSDRSYNGNRSSANPEVPKWVRRGNSYFRGHFPQEFFGTVVNPFQEIVRPWDEDAINVAMNCMANGAGSVMDANFVIRSVLGVHGIAETDKETKIAMLRGSGKLVARIARLNDINPSLPNRSRFNEFCGVEHPFTGAIRPSHLVVDMGAKTVDLSPEAVAVAKEASVPGGGCAALRVQVEYKGETIPMLDAFWDSAVDVMSRRLS